jgi:hypothetical protein
MLAGNAPTMLKTLVHPLIKESFTEKPDWKPEVKRQVVDSLKDDTKRFLDYAGRPHDHWSLDG